MTLVKFAWGFLRHHKAVLFWIVFLQSLQILLSLVLPALNARIIDDGILAENIPLIWQTGGVMLALSALQIASMVGAIYLAAKISMQFGRELRSSIFRKVQAFSATDQSKLGAPTLITRTTNDITQMQMVVLLTFTVMIMAPIMGVGGVVMALQQDVQLSAVLLFAVPALGIIIGLVMHALAPRFETQQKRIDRINTLLREQLTGVRVIRAFVRQPQIRAKFADANAKLRRVWLEIGLLWAFMIPAAFLVIGISSAAVIWFGGHRIESGGMQVGALTAYISYLMMIMMSVMMSGMMAMLFPRGEVSAKRIKEIDDTIPSITAPAEPKHLPAGPLTFELAATGLRYPGAEHPVLEDISLQISPGKTTAVIGSTGSGKSSLIKLIPRLIDATSGEVLAGGIPVRELDPKELRDRIAVVPQKAYLFSGTIGSNVSGSVRPNAPYDADRVRKALAAAQASDFVDRLDDGLDADVETGGKNFSGGQRQRLTIARAIYRCLPDENGQRQADLLIFDDSFSALDNMTDARLRRSLRVFVGDIAVLIIAQRVSTIREVDEIVVLDGGKVVGRGTHAELMLACPTYQEIVESQMSAEEAA